MPTLQDLLEKKVPDDYMENYKKVIQAKTSSKNVVSESSTQCEQERPMKNGLPSVPASVAVASAPRTEPDVVGESPTLKSNGVNYRIIASKPQVANTTRSNVSLLKRNGNNFAISNGKIRLVSGVNGTPKDETVFKAPVSAPSSDTIRKKFRMSTVPKKVPLINRVGNQSKLYAIPAPNQVPVTSSNGIVSETPMPSLPQVKASSKTMSILEARLTNPDSSIPVHPTSTNDENQVQMNSDFETVPVPNDNGVTVKIESDGTKPSKTINVLNYDKNIIYMNKKKAVLSFEKGITRLAAIEPRTITMVDVGMQVYIPDNEEQVHESSPQAQISSLQASSPKPTGSVQPAVTSSAMPMSQKQFVVVNKNGKTVLAIPRKMLRSYCGSKTIVIEDKSVKHKLETSLDLPSSGFSSETTEENSDMTKFQKGNSAAIHAKSSTLSLGAQLSHNNFVTVVSSLSANTQTTSSSLGQLSLTTPTTTHSNSSTSVVTPITVTNSSLSALSSSQPSALSSILSQSRKITSDSLVLPLNSPIKFDGGYFLKNSSDVSKLLSVSQSSVASPVQFTGNNAESLVLPLNSPTKAPSFISDSTLIRSAPNTSSLFILVPNSMNYTAPVPKLKPVVVHHQMGKTPRVSELVKKQIAIKRKDEVSASNYIPIKKQCTEPRRYENITVDLQPVETGLSCNSFPNQIKRQAISTSDIVKSNGFPKSIDTHLSNGSKPHNFHDPLGNTSNSVVSSNSNASPNTTSREDVDQFVKNAFAEFKNCLVFDKEGRLPIHAAVENNDPAAVKRHCIVLKARRASVNIPNSNDETPLQLALYHGYSSIAQVLLEHGADATVFDQEGNSPLHLAVIHAEDAVEALLLYGHLSKKFINCLNDEGFSALHLAAQHEKVRAIVWLTEYGADVDLQDGKSGRTALFHAVERRNYKAQKVLLSCGADMKEPTFSGSTPFLLTKSDVIAQLTSGQDVVSKVINSDTLLKSSRPSRSGKVILMR